MGAWFFDSSQGHIFIAGRTNSDNLPTREPWQQARRDSNDMFAARLNPVQSGAASLVYSTYLGGEGAVLVR